MNKLLAAAIGVLSLVSIASADRGDRHYPRRGGGEDRYLRQRVEASMRYERGSRNYDRTYVRYGQDNYIRRPSYDRDYVRRSDRGTYYVNGRAARSTWGFSLGYSSGYGYADDSISLGVHYSSRPYVAYRYPGYTYDRAPDIYGRRAVTYVPSTDYYGSSYEVRVYSAPSGYYSRIPSLGYSHFSRSYYCR